MTSMIGMRRRGSVSCSVASSWRWKEARARIAAGAVWRACCIGSESSGNATGRSTGSDAWRPPPESPQAKGARPERRGHAPFGERQRARAGPRPQKPEVARRANARGGYGRLRSSTGARPEAGAGAGTPLRASASGICVEVAKSAAARRQSTCPSMQVTTTVRSPTYLYGGDGKGTGAVARVRGQARVRDVARVSRCSPRRTCREARAPPAPPASP